MATFTVDWNKLPQLMPYTIRKGDTVEELWAFEVNSISKSLADVTSMTIDIEDRDGVSVYTAAIVPNVDEFNVFIPAATTATLTGIYRYEVTVVIPDTDATFTSGGTKVLVAGTLNVRDVV